MNAPQEDKGMSRRDFMKATVFSVGGLIGAMIGLPAIGYIVGPVLKQGITTWIRLGPIGKVELDNPTLFKTTVEMQTGWIKSREQISAYVLTENGQDYMVMSNICTHLGCRVRWIDGQQRFYCPCHNGVYAKDGSVISGPPPRPLDRFENKVEDGILYIKQG